MEYYTLMSIFYEVANHELQFSVWVLSEESCWNILMQKDGIYDQVNGTAGFCDVSEVASRSIRPLIRPDYVE